MIREKVIFEGRLEAAVHAAQDQIDKFRFDTFLTSLDIDMRVEIIGNKQLWVIYPSPTTEENKIINGYIEINPLSLDPVSKVEIRIVSCREELDILYFQLSQRLQAKFIIPEFPADIINVPWKDLVEQGVIRPRKTDLHEIIYNPPNPDDTEKKYGTDRNLTKTDVRRIVMRVKAYQNNGGTVEGYYTNETNNPQYELETLRAWMKNPDFKSP